MFDTGRRADLPDNPNLAAILQSHHRKKRLTHVFFGDMKDQIRIFFPLIEQEDTDRMPVMSIAIYLSDLSAGDDFAHEPHIDIDLYRIMFKIVPTRKQSDPAT